MFCAMAFVCVILYNEYSVTKRAYLRLLCTYNQLRRSVQGLQHTEKIQCAAPVQSVAPKQTLQHQHVAPEQLEQQATQESFTVEEARVQSDREESQQAQKQTPAIIPRGENDAAAAVKNVHDALHGNHYEQYLLEVN